MQTGDVEACIAVTSFHMLQQCKFPHAKALQVSTCGEINFTHSRRWAKLVPRIVRLFNRMLVQCQTHMSGILDAQAQSRLGSSAVTSGLTLNNGLCMRKLSSPV